MSHVTRMTGSKTDHQKKRRHSQVCYACINVCVACIDIPTLFAKKFSVHACCSVLQCVADVTISCINISCEQAPGACRVCLCVCVYVYVCVREGMCVCACVCVCMHGARRLDIRLRCIHTHLFCASTNRQHTHTWRKGTHTHIYV